MPNITIELLASEMKNLTREMRDGFKGVHNRLDIANGRMAKQETRSDRHKGMITDLEKQDIKTNERTKTTKLFWITMTFLLTAIGTLLGVIFG